MYITNLLTKKMLIDHDRDEIINKYRFSDRITCPEDRIALSKLDKKYHSVMNKLICAGYFVETEIFGNKAYIRKVA